MRGGLTATPRARGQVVAVENSLCPDYITEKALRAYRVGAVPVVFQAAPRAAGARPVPDYAQYFPPGSWRGAR